MAGPFRCKSCGKSFTVPESALAKFPGWTPSTCIRCRNAKNKSGGSTHELNLTLDEVLERFDGGPKTGLFTDGSCQPNPGPGGWGVVYVVDDEIIDQDHGYQVHTTNNQMELFALIRAFQMASPTVELDVWTDSDLCVKTINEWAAGWERRGWRRKGGEIKNLELIQELYVLSKQRPNLTLRWIKAHDGSRWNEYADSLATAWMRKQL